MKLIKKSIALFLAVLMISSSFAMLATAADAKHNWSSNTKFYRMQRNADGYIVDANGNVIADEDDTLTETGVPVWVPVEGGRVAKGEQVRARIFLQTDFAMTASQFFFVYPKAFLTHDVSKYETSGSSYTLLANKDRNTKVGQNLMGGLVDTSTEIGTSGWAYTQIKNRVITEADMEGLGWIFVNLKTGDKTIKFDGTEWLMEFCFTVNDTVSADDLGQVYLHPKCIAERTTIGRRAGTIMGADPLGEGQDFLGSDDSYLATGVDAGTFAYTTVDQDEDSTLAITTATLTFDANGGKFEDGSATKSETADIQPMISATLPENPSIAGGEFLGWVRADVAEPTEDDVLDAASIKYGYYDVTYKAYYLLENSATIVINYTDAVTGEAKIVNKVVPSKTGYTVKLVENLPAEGEEEANTTYVTFADLAVEHYAFDEANSTEREVVVAEDGSAKLNVYYAPVEYTAAFNPDNGEAATTETKAYWTEITAPAAPAKDGMKFTGWKLDGTDTVIAAGAKFNIAGNVTYTAQYELAETTVAVKVKYNDLAYGGAEKIVPHDTVETIAGYTVALAAAEGDAENTTYYLIENLPVIDHYEYDAANTVTTVTATADGKAELIVAYKPVKYTATFTGAQTFADVDYFTEITAPAGPVSAGQTFTGWKLVDTDTVIAAGAKFNIDANVTYEPVYDDIYYNTTASFNGEADVDYPADAVAPTVASGKMNEEIVLTDPVAVKGWNFLGWNTPVGAVEKDGKYYYGTTDVTVTGNWEHVEYTVTYWLDEAKTFYYDSQTYFYGDPVELPDEPPADLMPAGKEFVAWDTDIVSMPAEDIDIVASSNAIVYTVRINVNGDIVDIVEANYGDEITAEYLAKFEKIEGYTFNFWKGNNNKEITLPYVVKGGATIIADTTINKWALYFWEDKADYDAFMAGDETVEPYSFEEGVEFESPIVIPVDPTRESYVFKGWNIDPISMEDWDMHIYGIWKPETYTVIWDNDGKTYEQPGIEYGSDLDIPEVVPKEGYTFKGWAGLEEGATKMPDNGYEDGQTVTFTAVWEGNPYDAIFYLDEEKTQVHATVSTKFGEDIALPDAPSKDGYDFGGWSPEVGKMDSVDGKTFTAIWNAKGDIPYTVSIYTMDTEGNYGAAEVLNFSAATDAPVSYTPEVKEGFTLENDVVDGTVAADGSTNLVVKYIRNQYTFKTVVDGTETSSTTYYYEAAVAAPATPSKTGHTFSGWDGEIPAKMPAKDVTLSGTFTAAQFDLVYMVDGDQYSSVKVTFGDTVTVIAPLTKTGYTFSGWDKTGTFTMPAETVTISGTFTVNTHDVIYMVDGDEYDRTENVAYGTEVTAIEAPTKVGYTFSGWDKTEFTMPDADVTVSGTFTVNTHNVIYMVDGVEYQRTENVAYGTEVTAIKAPTKVGYTFSGWDKTAFTMGDADVVVSGTFTVNTHNVIYMVDGAEHQKSEVAYGTEVTVIDALIKEGYTFSGWDKTGTFEMPDEDVTISGSWTVNKHFVIYMVDGVEYQKTEVAYGTPVTVLDDLVEEGKTFSGWDKEDFTMPDSDVVINGSWTTNSYKVTYYTNKEMTEVHFNYEGALGANYNVPAIEKVGYEFLGWFNADGTAATLPEAGAIVTVPLNGAVYYADWKVIEYELVYNAGAGKFEGGSNTATFNTAYGTAKADWQKPADPTRPGYTFGGWNLDVAPATMPASKQVVAAIWNAIDYTVTWIDGDQVVTEHYIYDEEILAPEVEKEGFEFMGWLEADGVTYFADGDTMGEKSLVYTAQWEGEEGIAYTVYRYFENADKTGWMDAAAAKELTGKDASTALTGKAGDDAEVDAAAEAVDGFSIDSENSILKKEIAGDGSTALVIYYLRDTVSVTVKDPDGETYIDDDFTYGEEITIEDPEKEGFTFVEWQDGEGNKVTFPMTAPADDIVIKPIWTANKYIITFVDDNGDVIEAAKEVEFGSTIVAPADPEKDGYKFAYWRDKETMAVMPATMPAKDVTYEAYYTAGDDTTYYIEVYMMDTNGDYTMASRTVATGTTGDPISITPGTIAGCTYDASRSVLTGVITAPEKATLKVYYARSRYNVTFNAGEGTFEDGSDIATYKDVYFGAAIPVPAQPTRAGYDFAGWDAEVPATMPAGNLTFTATWTEAEYTITYVVNDKVEEVKTYKFGEAVEAPKTPNVAGMTFKYWVDADGNEIEIPATMPAEDIIIIAAFEISVYEVKYLVDGKVFQQYSVAHGDKIPVPTENPTKTYYTFKGWSEIPATMPAQDVEIHAVFERVPVELVPMDGSTTVIDDEKMAIYGLDIYLIERDLRDSYLKVNGDGYFTVTPSKGTSCGTGTVIELYDRANPETPIKTYTIVIFGDINGDANITQNDYSLAKAEVDMFTFWSDPMDESYDIYKTMAADFDGDGIISVKEASSINRYLLGAVDIDQTNGDIIHIF